MASMDAFDLLDHNCWREVFRKLDAIDHLSCRLVCTSFYDILEEERFQEKRRFHFVLPLLFPYLEQRDDQLGNIRLACQSWRQSVDKYLSEATDPPSFWSLVYSPLTIRFLSWSSEHIEEFHQKFAGYDGNPFPAKTLYLKMSQVKSYVKYNKKVTDFMERFGRHIHKLVLDLSLSSYNTGYFFVCKLIKSILIHLPNLKTFLLSCSYYTAYRGRRVRDDPQKMATWIGKNALPDLHKLKSLEINGLSETVENYVVEKYGSQLTDFRRLSYHIFAGPKLPNPVHPQLFPNLMKLSLDLRKYTDTLESLRFLQSPLKVLKLILGCPLQPFRADEPWNMDKVLRNLKHLPLECLKIRAYQDVNISEGDLALEDYINENIKTLSLHFIYFDDVAIGEISFNFLQALTKLEKLKLKFETGEEPMEITHPGDLPEELELLDYLEGGDMLYNSNLWEKVPSLKSLVMKRERITPNYEFIRDRSIYTREKYDAFVWAFEE